MGNIVPNNNPATRSVIIMRLRCVLTMLVNPVACRYVDVYPVHRVLTNKGKIILRIYKWCLLSIEATIGFMINEQSHQKPEHPVFIQLLALTPVLAVTDTLLKGLTIAICLTLVLALSGGLSSCFRYIFPAELRLPVHLLLLSLSVSFVHGTLTLLYPALADTLGIYVPMLAMSGLILSHLELSSRHQSVVQALKSALQTCAAVSMVIIVLSVIREFLAFSTLMHDVSMINNKSEAMISIASGVFPVASSPAGGLIALGLCLAAYKSLNPVVSEKDEKAVNE